MKRKIFALLSLVVVMAIALASCSDKDKNGKDGECEHTFSKEWASNETHHWHQATCEHGEQKDSYAPHVDTDENGECDTCKYEVGHIHTFSEDWSKDDTKHWKAATCSHTGEISEEALHTDDNKDGECDVCFGHVHILDEAGYCDGCDTQVEPFDETDVSKVINALVDRYSAVNGGKVEYSYNAVTKSITDGEGNNAYAKIGHVVNYTLGKNATYVERASDSEVYNRNDLTGQITLGKSTDLSKIWYYVDKDNNVKGIQEYTINDVMTPSFVDANEDSLYGYYYAVSTLADGYGAEAILLNLYDLSQADSASDYKFTVDTDKNTVSFSFNSLIINTDTAAGEDDAVSYFETSVEFAYSETFVLTSLKIVCDSYTNDPGTLSGTGKDYEADVDFDYDQETKTITMREGAAAETYTFVVTQTEGERTYVHSKDTSVYYPTDYEFSVGGEKIEDKAELTYNVGDDVIIDFVTVPDTYYEFVMFMLDTELVCDVQTSSYAFIDNDRGNHSIFIDNITAGNYTLTFYIEEELLLTVYITVEAPTYDGESFEITVTDNNTFTDQLVTFTATESGTYTFTIPCGYGAWDKADYDAWGSNPYVDPNMQPEGGSFSVDIAAGDSYSFYVSAPSKGTHKLPYTFEAKNVQPEEDDEDEEVEADPIVAGANSIIFTPEEIALNEAGRTLVATVSGDYVITCQDLFISGIYDENNVAAAKNGLIFTLEAGKTYTVKFGMFSMLSVFANKPYSLTLELPKVQTGSIVVGDNVINVTEEDISVGGINRPFEVTEEGTYTFENNSLMIRIYDENEQLLGTGSAYLTPGTYNLAIVTAYVSAAGNQTLTVTYKAPAPVDGSGSGTVEDPYISSSFPESITFESDTKEKVYYIFTANKTGTVTFTWPSADSWYDIFELDASGNNTSNTVSGHNTESFSFAVTEGTMYKVSLGTWDVAGEVTVTISFGEGETGSEDEETTSYTTYNDLKAAASEIGGYFYEFTEDDLVDGPADMGAIAGFVVVFPPSDPNAEEAAANLSVYKCKDVDSATNFSTIYGEGVASIPGWSTRCINDVVLVGETALINTLVDAMN